MAEATVYLKLKPKWRTFRGGEQKLDGFTVAGATKNQPGTGPSVRLTLRVPDHAFLPMRAEVTADAVDWVPMVTVEPAEPAEENEGQP